MGDRISTIFVVAAVLVGWAAPSPAQDASEFEALELKDHPAVRLETS